MVISCLSVRLFIRVLYFEITQQISMKFEMELSAVNGWGQWTLFPYLPNLPFTSHQI